MIADSLLLTAKLYIPPARVGHVARPRLTQRLDEVLRAGCRLAIVSAPAGYGKSTLLAEWVRSLAGPAGWMSVDEDDNDPARFVVHLIAAFGGMRPGVGEAALARLGAQQVGHDLMPVLSSLVNDLLAAPTTSGAGGSGGDPANPCAPDNQPPSVLVLDDYHLIGTDAVHKAMSFLLDHLPRDVRLVAAGRTEPALPLAKLRARGQLVEIGPADLAFSTSEAAEFLNEAMGLGLEAAEVAALEGRTEGWAAGLQLAALALQAGRGSAPREAPALLNAIAGGHRFIGDYLVDEVLARQPERVRRFLLQTSLLGRLEAGLCAEVMAEQPAAMARMLDELDRARLFLVPLDDERRWYRYHHLFAEALRAQLRRTQPELEPDLHRRAAAWYAEHDQLADAIHHILAAGDYAKAAAWIDAASDRQIRLGQLATIRGWIAALPEEVVRGDPALCVWACWTLLDGDRLEELEPMLQAADAALQEGGAAEHYDAERRSQLAGQLAVIRSQRAYRQGEPEEGMAQARLALRTLSPRQLSLRSFVSLNLGQRHLWQGEADAADELLTEAHRTMRAVHHPFIRLQIAEALAELRVVQARMRASVDVCGEALALADEHGLESLTAGLHRRLALVYLEQHSLDAAEQQAEALARLARRNGDVMGEAQAGLARARMDQARGDGEAAERAMDEAGRQLAPYSDNELLRWLEVWQARFWLAAGQVNRARAAMKRAGIGGDGDRLRESEALVLARLRLAEGRAAAALELAKRVRAAAEKAGRHGPGLRARVAQALAHQALGQASQALRVVEGVLSAAAPERFVRLFLDEGAPMLELLRRVAADYPQRAYTEHLLGLAGAVVRPAPPASRPEALPLAEALTGREREILALLAAGLTNQEIAARLVVAVDTVRWYSKQIYRKLEVHNRTQAVLRAQALGLT